jgi:imidazoleglycerol phosphate synthase glutamine amidotransferase subunit HisH
VKLNSGVYNVLKSIAQIYLPGVGTLYFALAQIWHLPAAEQVTGSIVAIDTFLGLVLGISSLSFNKSDEKYDGDMLVTTTPEGHKTMTLAMNGDPAQLDQKTDVVFKVIQK